LIDAGFAADDQPYLALEYVDGRPITDYCDERRLSVRERLELLRQVLSAVQYAHAHLVIHRDLKPSNILVTQDGQAHLLDFGIAKLLTEGEAKETELTRLGGRALTPDYAAPEQIAGAPITTAADVYALGVILYELLTGERPYKLKRDSRGALEDAILQADPLAPSRAALSKAAAAARVTSAKKLSSAFRGDLDTIAVKALKKSPAERYATANAFGEDITRFLRGDVVLAQPDSVVYRALKFARRHWVGIAAAGVLLLTLAGGLAATSYEARVASAQRDEALDARARALTQAAAARLEAADVAGALGIILEVLPPAGAKRSYTPEALSVFQEARAADLQLLAITGHTDWVRWAAFSPDGRRIVTASKDRTARIWDAAIGRQITLLTGHTDGVRTATFSPDGGRVVTAAADKTARIWDAVTGLQILLLQGHTEDVRSAMFSPDGGRVVTAAADKTARVWDARTGRQIMLFAGHTGALRSAAFSPDGRHIVTTSLDETARIWDAETSRQLVVLSGHTAGVNWAAFSADGSRIVTASNDDTARIWDAATGRELLVLSGHSQWVNTAAFSPDGSRIVTSSNDKTARVWDAATGRQTMLLSGHATLVLSAAFSPDGRNIVTASDDNTARVWSAAAGPILFLKGHTQLLAGAAFSRDGNQVATASMDKTARIWDAANGRQLMVLSGHTEMVLSAAFSPNGRHVVTASDDKTARIWDVETGVELLRLSGHALQVEGAAFSPDGGRVVTTSYDKTTRIWDAMTGRQIIVLGGHSAGVNWAEFSHDGAQVVTASFDKTARIWDSVTGRQLAVLVGHSNIVATAAFSPDGERVVTASDDNTARIWDAATARQITVLSGHSKFVTSAEFSPDGQQVVTSSYDGTARVWEAATGRQLMVLSHPGPVYTATFSPDGRRILTASDDKTARIWDSAVPAIEIQVSWAEAAQFDPLPRIQKFRLGLADPADARQWPTAKSKCDESAAAPYDPDRRAPGVMLAQIVADIAIAACADQGNRPDNAARAIYQGGRAQLANGHFAEARQDFENAIARGERAARLDLGLLLALNSAGMSDVPRAISLLDQAWKDGVTAAAFELGTLYENGINRPGNDRDPLLNPDSARAWAWYQRAADAGEARALARFAARAEDAAVSEDDAAKRNALLLDSFKYYAAASERSRIEDWPDDAWRTWRYRRASLARVLAGEGMMRDVANGFEDVRKRYSPAPTTWLKLTSLIGLTN
jgi:WD40 repeat protein